jgi:virginiamycin B lyase
MLNRTPLVLAAAVAALPFSVSAQGLPNAPGKELVEAYCTGCHNTNQITNSMGYDRDGWAELIANMVDLSGSSDKKGIVEYLATHFPSNGNRQPTLVAGDAKISLKEWTVPTLGQRARDPVEAPDGSIWWVGQFGNVIGRLDPATGEMKEINLPEGAYPHNVTLDAEGNAWYTGNKNGTMGRVDAKTGEIMVYLMPDPKARDPHTAIVDGKGRVFFSLQGANMVGRLIPETSEIKLITMPIARSNPYGVRLDSKGNPWIASNGTNHIYKLDPETMELTDHVLPTPGTTVRRIAFAADDVLWYVNSSKGKIGRLDTKTGAIKEWDSPSGSRSHPYAIEVIDGIVWYNESGMRPDTLVRFDPATEKFQSWVIPSGGIHAGIVRHMRPTKDGKLLIHQSSSNRIILVDTKPPATN